MCLVKETLNKLADIPNINRGGCLYAAYAVYLTLKKENLHESVNILQNSSWESEVESNKAFLEGKGDKIYSADHFLILYNGEALDANSNFGFREKYFLIIPNGQTEIFCENSLKYGSWNPRFDKKKYIPIINQMLGINLEIYE